MNKSAEENIDENKAPSTEETNKVENNPSEEKVENTESSESSEINKEEELQKKLDELNDKYLRLFSEYDNFRKRTAREKIELSKSAGEDIFKSVLPALDDFERGLKSINQAGNVEAVKEGVELIYKKLKSTLVQKGLEEMKTTGEPFDSDLHEAITNVPAPSEELKGKVIDEVEKGYLLNGKVIRYAKVVVGN